MLINSWGARVRATAPHPTPHLTLQEVQSKNVLLWNPSLRSGTSYKEPRESGGGLQETMQRDTRRLAIAPEEQVCVGRRGQAGSWSHAARLGPQGSVDGRLFHDMTTVCPSSQDGGFFPTLPPPRDCLIDTHSDLNQHPFPASCFLLVPGIGPCPDLVKQVISRTW